MTKFALAILYSTLSCAVSGTRLGLDCLEDVYQDIFAEGDDFWLERGDLDIDNEWWWSTDMGEMYDLGQQDDWYAADFDEDDEQVGDKGPKESDDWGDLKFDDGEGSDNDDEFLLEEGGFEDREDKDDWATLD